MHFLNEALQTKFRHLDSKVFYCVIETQQRAAVPPEPPSVEPFCWQSEQNFRFVSVSNS